MILCVTFAVIEFIEVFIVCSAVPSSDVPSASASTSTDDSKTHTEAQQQQKPQQTTEQSTVKSRSQSMAEVMQIQQQTLDAESTDKCGQGTTGGRKGEVGFGTREGRVEEIKADIDGWVLGDDGSWSFNGAVPVSHTEE